MILNNAMFEIFKEKAARTRVDLLSLGLGYTTVVTADGGIGIAYTYFENKTSCMMLNDTLDYEGRPAAKLLVKIKSDHPIERSMALALINALNYDSALSLPEDKDNTVIFNHFRLRPGTHVAMVGYFGPLVRRLEEKGVPLKILDDSREIGNRKDFFKKLGHWADVLILTSTSILNSTTEEIISHLHKKAKTLLLGPSTPMVAKAFAHLPVHMLAGTVPLDKDNIIKAVRHGRGTPVLQRYSRKSYLALS